MDGSTHTIHVAPAAAATRPGFGDAVPVAFSFRPPGEAGRVSIAGTFNGWSLDSDPMQNDPGDGVFETIVYLQPGAYHYKFVVDGWQWYADPGATGAVDDGHGGRNSVIVVSAESLTAAASEPGIGQMPGLLWHDPGERRFFSETAPGRYALRLRADRNVLEAWVEMSGVPSVKMRPLAALGPFEYFEVDVQAPDDSPGYIFRVIGSQDTRWLGRDGVKNENGSPKPFPFAGCSPVFFETPDWVKNAVFYQIFPERFANGDPSNDPPEAAVWHSAPTCNNYFGGDLQGIRDRIPYLKELGITAVYLNPVFASRSNHKYDTCDYFRVDPHFGTNALFAQLVKELHAAGIRVILDVVYNHTGVDFPPFQDVAAHGASSPYKDWYFFHGFPVRLDPPNYECWWGLRHMPKLNTGNPEVQKYLFDATRYWLELGVDGFRLDVACDVPHEFWVEYRRVVKSVNPEAYIVGEIWQDGTPWLRGDQFDAVMNYRFRDEMLGFFARRELDIRRFDEALSRLRLAYPAEAGGAMLNLLASHDTERLLTAAGGNLAAVKLAVLLQLTYPGAPCIYYGDEVGMDGGKDPGCRGGFPWDPRLQDADLLHWHRRLIALRNRHTPLRTGGFRTLEAGVSSGIYAFLRTGTAAEDGDAVVVLNCGNEAKALSIECDREMNGAVYEGISEQWIQAKGRKVEIGQLAPGSGAVVILPAAV